MPRKSRIAGRLGLAVALSLLPYALNLAAPAAGPTARAATTTTTPNRFAPTARAAPVKGAALARPAPATRQRTAPAHPRPPTAAGMQPAVVALDPAQPVHFSSPDSGLELDLPAGAVSPAEVAAAGGSMSLLVRQVLPASGGSAGGSGHFTFGTFLVQALDANGQLANQGLRQPLSFKQHFGSRAGAMDVSHAIAVINRPLPRWVSLDPGPALGRPAVTGPLAGALMAASVRPATVDGAARTLAATAAASGSSTTVSFDTVAPVSSTGAPDRFEADPSAGALALQYPLQLPGGPGGLTPPLSLDYDSASVSDQHDVAAAAPWVGEGWNLSLGRISWSERDITEGCTTTCPGFQWGDTWTLVDGFGTRAELVPPNLTTSTYYEDFNGTAISPSPVSWRTAPETHARVVSYVGPGSLPGMAANPPCFRVFLPSGVMEEFGCTPDSLQFYPQPSGPNQGLDYIASWLLDLITDPQGNQVHVTYQQDMASGVNGASYPRDAELATVEYDSPGCHSAQTACTGSAWAPQIRVAFQAAHSVAHVAGSSCAARGSLRCDDPADLSGSSGMAPPTVENTFVLNDALVQVRASASAAWNTLLDYRLAYDQSAPTTITDPFGGTAQSTAGRLNLTRLTEIGADGSTALPARSFSYARQTQYYEDSVYAPAPATNCGPSWNAGQTFSQGCNLWSQSYEGNSYYLSAASNGLGLQQTFSWQLARDNFWGAPSGGDILDPFACDGSAQSATPCDVADDQSWSRVVLTQRTEGLVRLTQAGQGGGQTSTPVTGTFTYGYRMAQADSYWGDAYDFDVLDFYNERFMGFATATVTRPDGSKEVITYPSTLGVGVFDPNDSRFSGICTSSSPCNASPWWNPANSQHGQPLEVDTYNPDGSLVQVLKNQYQNVCPPAGVSGDEAGNLVTEMDWGNPVAVCDVAPSQVDQYLVNGGSQTSAPHLTTAFARDAYGRVTSGTVTSSDGGATGSPTTIVSRTSYTQTDAVSATSTSATGTYLVDLPTFQDVEDSSGNRYHCGAVTYDSLGQATRSDVYTSCGTAANSFAQSGQISATRAYDQFGNPIATDDPDALAGSSSHLGCQVAGTAYSGCAGYDGTFASLPTTLTNALGQQAATGYQPAASGTATGGFGLWPISATDANGQTTGLSYDALGRPTGITLPGEGTGLNTASTSYTISCSASGAQAPCIEIDKALRLNGSTTVTSRAFYDGLGHLVETRTPAPGGQDVVRYSLYDPSRRLAFASVPYLVGAYTGSPGAAAYSIPDSNQAGTTFTYDGLGRATGTTDALSHRSTTAYSVVCGAAGADSACYEQKLGVDGDGHQSGVLGDALGRAAYEQRYTGGTSSTYALYATARYTYDFLGNLTRILQPDGATTTTVQYDMAGRPTSMTDPDRGTETYGYDPSGNLVHSVDARGAAGTVFIGYDGLDRPLWHNTTNSPTGAYETFAYDSTAGGNDGVGRLTSETFSSGSLSGSYSFAYDARGRDTATTLSVNGVSYPVSTAYDDAGNVVSQTYPTGETVSDVYTAQGWLSAVSTQLGSTTTSLLSGASYGGVGGAFGDLTGASLAGTTYTYASTEDLLGRATDLKVARSGGATLFEQARTFDAAGNVATAQTTLPAGTDSQTFGYDEQNRLTAASASGISSAQYSQSFAYDALGRLTSGPLGGYTYGSGAHVHAATALGSGYTASYDAAGDMTCRAATSSTTCAGSSPTGAQLGYDSEGRLVSWQGGGISDRFLYDPQGRRVAQQATQGGATTTTIYVGGVEAVTTSGSTTTTQTYYHAGGSRIATAVNGTFTYLASDALGSPTVALNASGSAVASQLFTPYGGVRFQSAAMPTDYGFTGQRADAASGLSYFGSRYYDPVAGQFTSADTVVPGAGFDLQGLSRYAYTRGNPTSRVDPTGHDDGGDFGGDFGGGDFIDSGFVDGGSVDTGGGDTGTGFDPSAPSIDRSEDPNFGLPASDATTTGFDPSAPSIDRSEDPNFGLPTSDGGGAGTSAGGTGTDAAPAGSGDGKDPATEENSDENLIKVAMDDQCAVRAACHQGGPGTQLPPPAVPLAPPGTFPTTQEQAPATTTTTTNDDEKKDVLVDTNAVFRFNDAKALIGEDERPVVTTPTETDEIARIAALKGFSGNLPAGVGVIPDDNSAVLRGMMMDALRQFGASPTGMEADATIGATALARGIPLITGDVDLFNAFTKLGGQGRLLR
jgi:RHS repeat-associated protein